MFNRELLQPRNLLVIVGFSFAALWLAKRFIPHACTQPGAMDPTTDSGAGEVNNVSVTDLGNPDFRVNVT